MFVHAHAHYIQRRRLWSDIIPFASPPLLVIGDFNAVLGAHERRSTVLPSRISCEEFRNLIDSCLLVDVTMTGSKFTWCGRQHTKRHVESRIDRALVSE